MKRKKGEGKEDENLARHFSFAEQKTTVILKGYIVRGGKKTAERSKRLTSRQSAKLANLVQYSIHEDVAQALCGSLTP